MAEGLLTISYDASSLATIANFSNFSSRLQTSVEAALDEAGKLVVQIAQANTWTAFSHPTGHLAENIAYEMAGPMEAIIQVGVPYAWRMEEGFFGTDSLGRTYSEAGKPYAAPALQAVEAQIMVMLGTAAAEAFVEEG